MVALDRLGVAVASELLPNAMVAVTRHAPGVGGSAWQQLATNTGRCIWRGTPEVQAWPGHAQGRIVAGEGATGVVMRVDDFIISATQISGAQLSPAALQALGQLADRIASNLRAQGLVK